MTTPAPQLPPEPPRYYMFGVNYTSRSEESQWENHTTNFRVEMDGFPSNAQLQQVVIEKVANASIRQIVILSICELSKEDDKKFWSE